MIPNRIHKVLSTMAAHRVQALLMGGQACVLYGAGQFSGRQFMLAPVLRCFRWNWPFRGAGFKTCCAADFQIGTGWNVAVGAGLEARDTADLEVCATRQEEGVIVIIAPDGGNM